MSLKNNDGELHTTDLTHHSSTVIPASTASGSSNDVVVPVLDSKPYDAVGTPLLRRVSDPKEEKRLKPDTGEPTESQPLHAQHPWLRRRDCLVLLFWQYINVVER
jgi:hypothetical protein